MGADGVEVAERNGGKLRIRVDGVGDDTFGEDLSGAVRRCGCLEWRLFGYGELFWLAVD